MAVTQSYKQVKMIAPVSVGAATQQNVTMASGVDNYAGPTAGNNSVPTGAVIRYIEVQLSFVNLVSIASFLFVTIQHLRSGQSAIDNQAIGGDPQRNQVHLQILRTIGKEQNTNITIRFKVPAKFQRVREGDIWAICTKSDTIHTYAGQIIYKFYR